MTKAIQTVIERGKKKNAVAFAPDWPGLSRGASSAERALEKLETYADRYRGVAALAGLSGEFPATPKFKVVEELTGTGSTDFWAISWVPATSEQGPMSKEGFERKLVILRACWKYFDRVEARVSAELKKGPRGGGRDRDQIVRHIFANEQQWAKMLAVDVPDDAMLTAQGRAKYRNAYVRGLRAYNAAGKSARTWQLQFLLRHTAFHVMDHAWEMEDKDLTNVAPTADQ
jgi:hypothetical protein